MSDDLRNRVARAIDTTIRIDNGFNIENLPEVADAALSEIGAVREMALLNIGEAMQELANSPIGVIPMCAEKYYDGNTGVFTAERILRAIAEGKNDE